MTDDSVSRYVWNRWNVPVYVSNVFALFFFTCCLLKQNRDLFNFGFVPEIHFFENIFPVFVDW